MGRCLRAFVVISIIFFDWGTITRKREIIEVCEKIENKVTAIAVSEEGETNSSGPSAKKGRRQRRHDPG